MRGPSTLALAKDDPLPWCVRSQQLRGEVVSDMTDCLAVLTQPRRRRTSQSVKAINTLRDEDQGIFTSCLSGANTINDFRN